VKILYLGTGSAFCQSNWQSNYLIKTEKSNLLLDCGTDARRSLPANKLSYLDIKNVYISHLHADHVGGLGELGLFNKFLNKGPKVKLFANEALIDDIWSTVRPSLATLQNEITSLGTYFDVITIKNNGTFTIDDVEFRPVQVMHIYDGYNFQPSFGLIVKTLEGKKVFFTTDTQFNPNQLQDFYNDANYIVSDCEVGLKSGVHSHFDELCTLSPDIKKNMVLTHYSDIVWDNFDEWQKKAVDNGFIGFVKPGQEFSF